MWHFSSTTDIRFPLPPVLFTLLLPYCHESHIARLCDSSHWGGRRSHYFVPLGFRRQASRGGLCTLFSHSHSLILSVSNGSGSVTDQPKWIGGWVFNRVHRSSDLTELTFYFTLPISVCILLKISCVHLLKGLVWAAPAFSEWKTSIFFRPSFSNHLQTFHHFYFPPSRLPALPHRSASSPYHHQPRNIPRVFLHSSTLPFGSYHIS